MIGKGILFVTWITLFYLMAIEVKRMRKSQFKTWVLTSLAVFTVHLFIIDSLLILVASKLTMNSNNDNLELGQSKWEDTNSKSKWVFYAGLVGVSKMRDLAFRLKLK